MSNIFKSQLSTLVLLLFAVFTPLFAQKSITEVHGGKTHILPGTTLFVSKNEMNLSSLTKQTFSPLKGKHLNLGITKDYIYLQFTLKNPTPKPLTRVLVINSPFMEDVVLYNADTGEELAKRGIRHINGSHTTLPFYFDVQLPPYGIKSYLFKIHQDYNGIDFVLTSEEKKTFLENDRRQQAINLILLGMVVALMLYSLFLSFYIKDRSYLFYGFYLFMLIYQQITYLGFTQAYFPAWFVQFDMRIDILKLSLLMITAILFAMSFLETKWHPYVHKAYQLFLVIAALDMLLLDPKETFSLSIVLAIGILFIFFNLFSAIYIYYKGLKQARLFIMGFGVVSLFYIAMILDTLGITSLMYYFNNAMMWGTAFEAFILSLAFADRYMILQKEKHATEKKMLYEVKHRAEIVEEEVEEKTRELNSALKMKETLIKEIHHRVKNNLQLILSIIRLQKVEVEDSSAREKLSDLEQRINAISETYQMLISNTDVEEVNMENYIETLLIDISESFSFLMHRIDVKTDIDITLPIRDAVYVGIIINELVTNIYKYAFDDKEGEIYIAFKEKAGYYTLIVSDSGKGYDPAKEKTHLGIKLIHTLVYDQLGGEMEVDSQNGTRYTIRFPV